MSSMDFVVLISMSSTINFCVFFDHVVVESIFRLYRDMRSKKINDPSKDNTRYSDIFVSLACMASALYIQNQTDMDLMNSAGSFNVFAYVLTSVLIGKLLYNINIETFIKSDFLNSMHLVVKILATTILLWRAKLIILIVILVLTGVSSVTSFFSEKFFVGNNTLSDRMIGFINATLTTTFCAIIPALVFNSYTNSSAYKSLETMDCVLLYCFVSYCLVLNLFTIVSSSYDVLRSFKNYPSKLNLSSLCKKLIYETFLLRCSSKSKHGDASVTYNNSGIYHTSVVQISYPDVIKV